MTTTFTEHFWTLLKLGVQSIVDVVGHGVWLSL